MRTSFQSLAWLKQHLGPACAEVRVQGHEPLLLDDPSCAYATLSEHHQLFCVGYDKGRAVGRREHVATLQPGQLVFGLEPVAETALLLAGASGSVVWRFPTALLLRLVSDSESRAIVAQLLDGWLRLRLDTLPRLAERRASLSAARLARDRASRNAETELVHAALGQLARVGNGRRLDAGVSGDAPLARACNTIAWHLGVPPPELPRPTGDDLARLQRALSSATGLRSRPVRLERDWHVHQSGPLLGYLEASEGLRPVALLPTPRGYRLHDPATDTVQAIDASLANTLLPQAHQFYRALPAGAARPLDVLRVAARGAGRDIAFVLGLGMATGPLAMLVPWLTALVFDRIIPGAEQRLLRELSVVILAVYVSLALFDLARGLVLARVQTRMDSTLEAAVWDRLLSLPLAFFKKFSAGDLAARAAGFGRIRDVLVGSAASALLGGLFSLWNLALLLYIDPTLACAGLGWIGALVAALMVSAYRSLDRERAVATTDGKISGLLLQMFSGIGKLRTSAAENRAFSAWAKLFAERRDADLAAEGTKLRAGVLGALVPTLASVTLFWLSVRVAPPTLTAGEFLAFAVAFGSFLGSMQRSVEAALESLSVIPLYERAKPILEHPVEAKRRVNGRIELRGAIELSHVSFRYSLGSPLVLDDVDLRIDAGEFVAVVGASGSGKSTLLRILMGFEECSDGAVFYDDQALTSLDVRQVRQQLGVVLQTSRVSPGDVYTNIAGNTGLTMAEAWRAAHQAALAKDIEAMPMGMHTVVSQGGGMLSGGQRQRLLIARALARSPRVLLLDEATSALDNVTQAMVSESLAALRVTRIVIAHRLSTIRHADKIVVLERGRVVEVGCFAELMGKRGAFWQLAQRQTV